MIFDVAGARTTTSLTSASQAGVFFRKEAQCGKAFDLKAKQEVIMALDNKSTREVDRILISNSSSPEIHFKEKIIPRSETTTEVRMHIDEETLAAINRLKEIWSHAMPSASIADIVNRATKEAVEKHDPVKKIERAEKKKSTPAPEGKANVRRMIWKRDESRCTLVDTRSGERCGTRHFVEEDHIMPKAMGGSYSFENIRLRCRAHNQRHAINCFGPTKMRHHMHSMR